MKYLNKINQHKSPNGENAESAFRQIFSVFSIAYLCISCGNFLGYTSSAVPSMKEDVEMFTDLSSDDISWIGGLGPLGALFGSLMTLIPLPRLGARRTVAFFGAPVLICSWLTIGFANSVNLIFLGRFLGGTGTGMVISCAPLYVLDISSINVRGRLGILPQFLMIFGILVSYILGSFLNWRYLAMTCALITTPSIVLLAFAPDSPTWLVAKNRIDEAYQTLEKLHGSRNAATVLGTVQTKVAADVMRRQKIEGVKRNRIDFAMIKASAVALGILSFQQLTGINGVTFYAVSIFRQAAGDKDGQIDAHIPSIILASTQLIASFTSSLLVERYGRKVLLTSSSILMTIAGTTLGTYFYCGTQISSLFWVPLTALIVFAFGFAIGYGPVAWILTAEILPEEIRHFMNPLAIGYNWFCVFIVTKSFPLLLLEINIYGIFWMYACVALVGLVFVTFCIPETKGKTADEIRLFFGKAVGRNFDIERFDELKNISDEDNSSNSTDDKSLSD